MLVAVPFDPAAPPSAEEFRRLFNGPEAMHGIVNVDSGHVTGDDREGCRPLTPDWIDYLRTAIDHDLLHVLQDAWIETKMDADDPPKPYVRQATPGRNDPCPCGSGKKFKRCCG
jgi:uncharacterized protein YecA (UPF0149 family)